MQNPTLNPPPSPKEPPHEEHRAALKAWNDGERNHRSWLAAASVGLAQWPPPRDIHDWRRQTSGTPELRLEDIPDFDNAAEVLDQYQDRFGLMKGSSSDNPIEIEDDKPEKGSPRDDPIEIEDNEPEVVQREEQSADRPPWILNASQFFVEEYQRRKAEYEERTISAPPPGLGPSETSRVQPSSTGQPTGSR